MARRPKLTAEQRKAIGDAIRKRLDAQKDAETMWAYRLVTDNRH